MRRLEIGADPDSAPRTVTLPAAWEDGAAAALAALAPGEGPVSAGGRGARLVRSRLGVELEKRALRLLLLRRAAPTEAVWPGRAADDPGYVLNLPAFLTGDGHFDVEAFAAAVETAVEVLTVLAPAARDLSIGMADLSRLLAASRDSLRHGRGARRGPLPRRVAARARGCRLGAIGRARSVAVGLPRAARALRDPRPGGGGAGGADRGDTAAFGDDGDPDARRGGGSAGGRDRRHRALLRLGFRGWRSDPHRARLAWRLAA